MRVSTAGRVGSFSLRWQVGPWVLIVVVCLLHVAISTVCLIDMTDFISQPYPGFWVNPRLAVEAVGTQDSPGLLAGLRYNDRLLTAQGVGLENQRDLHRVIRATGVGRSVEYVVERGGRQLSVEVPVTVFTVRDFVHIVLPPYAISVVFLGLGLVVFALKPATAVTWVFFFACYWYATGLTASYDFIAAQRGLFRWVFLANYFLPACLLHLSLIFPERHPFVEQYPWVQVLPYGVSAVPSALLVVFYPDQRLVVLSLLAHPYRLVAILAVLLSSVVAFWWGATAIGRQRAKVVCWGGALTLLPPLAVRVGWQAGLSLFVKHVPLNLLILPAAAFPAFVGYAIVKHNLFDVDRYIKRTVGYVLMTSIVAMTYFTVQAGVSTFVLRPLFGSHAESLYPIVFALLVVFFFNPVNRAVQDGVDRLFFRKTYDYKRTVSAISDALTTVLDLDAIMTKVVHTVRDRLYIDKAGVVLIEGGKDQCKTLFFDDPAPLGHAPASLCLSSDDPLLALLARQKTLITKYDIEEAPEYAAVRDSCRDAFSRLGASVAIPLLHQQTVVGALAVGYKKSGHFYSRDDIDLLKTISTMTATAIEQAREKEQRATLMQLFSKHVSPEVAEALWQERDQFLEGGRPRSQKLVATVMFTDLQGFTGVSEKLEPQALLDWLNQYMEMIARTIMDHGGVVDDYFGDGVKANFGVPVPRTTDSEIEQDAINAVTCSLALNDAMRALNERMARGGMPTLRMRIGLYTGPVVAGSLGSADRMKYTTIGDTVNTAARLESFDKSLVLPHLETNPARILVGDATLQRLGSRFEVLPVGELSLKGKEERIAAYCVLGSAPQRLALT